MVWQRLLTVHYGVGSVSITLIISVYMFGLGVGALFGGFLAERARNRIIWFFAVQFLLGLFGLISLPFLDLLGRHTAGSSYLVSFFYMFLFLCLPTFVMGITLPLLTKIFNHWIRDFLYSVSYLYFINTLGAAIGAVFASYAIISFFGLDIGIYFASAVNFVLAAVVLIAMYSPAGPPAPQPAAASGKKTEASLGRIAYLLVLITGFLAIGYEIVWFRVVGVLVKASPYAFSSVLCVYLLGVALGSLGITKYLRRQRAIGRRNLFFLFQFIIGLYVMVIFIGYYYLTKHTYFAIFTQTSFTVTLHPTFAVPTFESLKGFLIDVYGIIDVFFWSVVFVLVPTLLMGASFPLISSLALLQVDKEGKTVGTVYFFNIAGNVLGGILTGFLLLPLLGTENTLLAFSSTGVLLGLFVTSFAGKRMRTSRKIGIVLILLAANVLFFPKRGQMYEVMHVPPGENFTPYLEEGIDAVIMTYQNDGRVVNYINGLGHGQRPGHGFYYLAIEAMSFAPRAENVLVIGYGTGSIVEAVLKSDEVKKVTIVELSGTLMNNLMKMDLFQELLADGRLEVIIDDGRRFLLRTDEKFDLILMDPIRRKTSYSNNIYSKQFFELAAKHLNPGGIILTYATEHRVMPKTVHSAFNSVRVYSNFCLGSDRPLRKYEEREDNILAGFSSEEREGIKEYREEYEKYLGDESYIREVSENYPINQDWKPVCEYYLGLEIREKLFPDEAGPDDTAISDTSKNY